MIQSLRPEGPQANSHARKGVKHVGGSFLRHRSCDTSAGLSGLNAMGRTGFHDLTVVAISFRLFEAHHLAYMMAEVAASLV